MKEEEIVVGARVKCVHNSDDTECHGKIGTITKGKSNLGIYWVRFDNMVHDMSWCFSDSFVLLDIKMRYTIKGICKTPHIFTYPTSRGHEAWVDVRGDAFTKREERRVRYQNINEAYSNLSRYYIAHNEWQYVVDETE